MMWRVGIISSVRQLARLGAPNQSGGGGGRARRAGQGARNAKFSHSRVYLSR